MAMIENIYDTMNIRVQETAFELHLRKIYPTRNILSFRETDTIFAHYLVLLVTNYS